MADIFKTPDQWLQDESKGEVQFNTKTRKPFEGAEDETVKTDFFRLAEICADVYTSWENCYTKTADTAILHQTEHSTSQKNAWDTTEDSTIILQAVYR